MFNCNFFNKSYSKGICTVKIYFLSLKFISFNNYKAEYGFEIKSTAPKSKQFSMFFWDVLADKNINGGSLDAPTSVFIFSNTSKPFILGILISQINKSGFDLENIFTPSSPFSAAHESEHTQMNSS